MSDASRMLAEFHTAFAHPSTDDPALRPRLHDEEHDELMEALASGDLEAIARELADVLYIAYGTAHVLGIDLDAALAAVHAANMSKLFRCFCTGDGRIYQCESCGDCVPYVDDPFPCAECGATSAMVLVCGACEGSGTVALRRADGKILKGPDYRPPDMAAAVRGAA